MAGMTYQPPALSPAELVVMLCAECALARRLESVLAAQDAREAPARGSLLRSAYEREYVSALARRRGFRAAIEAWRERPPS
ncbi:MAG TPA: hypothetical protein VFL98_01025 [Candidatus Paceibacterota bacterium]|nr:hypothetical protein [Candidatus Paceibacterota bacterium]